ncbi:hemin uptake protein HemP [Sulfitobacter sp. LCG007]
MKHIRENATAQTHQEDTPVFDARHMTGSGGLAHIVLDGQVYTLRITRAGKLILTK